MPTSETISTPTSIEGVTGLVPQGTRQSRRKATSPPSVGVPAGPAWTLDTRQEHWCVSRASLRCVTGIVPQEPTDPYVSVTPVYRISNGLRIASRYNRSISHAVLYTTSAPHVSCVCNITSYFSPERIPDEFIKLSLVVSVENTMRFGICPDCLPTNQSEQVEKTRIVNPYL